MSSDELFNQTLGGQYQIKSLLGRGGMATVYLARQTSMDRDVAIKVMAPELADDEQFVTRFEHEAQVIASLQHPHILPVIDFGREGKHVFIVMRLVRGGSLDDRLQKGPLDLPLASRMLDQIASALTFAHEQGIIHRDLKPNNVLLDERMNAYLTDFGIAKMLAGTTKLTATGNILGTPSYMAPEQWRGDPVDARTDIYSLGVMSYEMVLGSLPFSGETPYTLMYKHFNDPPPIPREVNPDIEPGVEAVILYALAKEPDGRYQSAEAMAQDFDNAVRGLPTIAPQAADIVLDETLVGEEIPGDLHQPTVRGEAPARAAVRAPAPPQPATQAHEPVPAPARRGINPIMIGAAVVVVLAAIIGGIFALSGGGEEDTTPTPVEAVVEPTNTPAPSDTPSPEPTNTPTDTPEPTETFTITPSPTERTTTATVLSQRLNVRSGPGQDYDPVGTLDRDDDVLVNGISEDGAWYQVVFGTQLGWVSAEFVRISGNMNIAIAPWPTRTPTPSYTPSPTDTPTDTPSPTDTPTDTPSPTSTATDTLEPTNTPSPTNTPTDTLEPTDTPEPINTATNTPPEPSETPYVGEGTPVADASLFLPTSYARESFSDIGLTIDYPTQWERPTNYGSGIVYYVNVVDILDDTNNLYPSMTIARGSPETLLEEGLTSDITSLKSAIETMYGSSFSGKAEPDDTFNFPAYKLDSGGISIRAWAWLFELADDDWLYVIAFSPAGQYDNQFNDNILVPMVNSIEVDQRALSPAGGITASDATPGATQVAGLPVDLTLFVPTGFKRITLDTINVSLEYPVNWLAPTQFGVLFSLLPVDSESADADRYPILVIARGTPEQVLGTGVTNDISSPAAAAESVLGATTFSGMHTLVDTFIFPTYTLDVYEDNQHVWVWLAVISDTDWLYILSVAPTGNYDGQFAVQSLDYMISSITVDQRALLTGESSDTVEPELPTEVLTSIPVTLGTLISDDFDGNQNGWELGEISDGKLVVDTPTLDYLGWTFPNTIEEAENAFYVQVSADLVRHPNFWEYGLAFRLSTERDFYYYTINHAGEYALFNVSDGSFTEVIGVTPNALINLDGSAPNTLGVLVIGDYIELFINGQAVTSVADPTHSSGNVRLTAYTFADSDGTVAVAFDKFVYMPILFQNPALVNAEAKAIIGTITSDTADMRVAPDAAANSLITLSKDQRMVVFARSADSASIYGYTSGYSGWIDASQVDLTHVGSPVGIGVLLALESSVPGAPVDAWPIKVGSDAEQPAADTDVTLSYGASITGELTEPGDTHADSFLGSAGDVVTIAADAAPDSQLDTYLTLFGPDGTQLADDDDDGPGLNALIENVTLPADGVYTVEVQSVNNAGMYTLTLTKEN